MDTIELSFTQETLNVVMRALQELPYRVSAPVLEDLHKQITNTVAENNKANDNDKETK